MVRPRMGGQFRQLSCLALPAVRLRRRGPARPNEGEQEALLLGRIVGQRAREG
jgi:hypothetical protein